jgi:hypothetical protein
MVACPLWHLVFECGVIGEDARHELLLTLPGGSDAVTAVEALSSILSLPVDCAAYVHLIALSVCIERESQSFWRSKGKHHLE